MKLIIQKCRMTAADVAVDISHSFFRYNYAAVVIAADVCTITSQDN